MAKFTYTARNKEGKSSSGTVEAASRQALTETLTKQGLHPLSVKQAAGEGGLVGWDADRGQFPVGIPPCGSRLQRTTSGRPAGAFGQPG